MPSIRPQTRDAIIEAAFQLFSEQPRASLNDVAARAGIGRATLHRHFALPDDLMTTLARITLEELDAAVDVVEPRSDRATGRYRLLLGTPHRP
ncbi:MAG: helix-turn-helix transcriptional regulator [Rhodobacteraceae bacterium]|nr:helix-turn-helix transcriptional regulator [Paracoccaceae bacterium]